MARKYWLMKSEPDVFGWDDLLKEPKQTAMWDGVRNYRARNFLRDGIKKGDGVFFYHSNADPKAVVGTCKVVKGGYPDPTQFDPAQKYYDPKSPKDAPRWYCVDVQADKAFKRPVTLAELKETPGLEECTLIKRGNRLSVLPITPEEWKIIRALGTRKTRPS